MPSDVLVVIWATGWGVALTWWGVQPIFHLIDMIAEDVRQMRLRRHDRYLAQPGSGGGDGRGGADP